jgi:hypothetical protein
LRDRPFSLYWCAVCSCGIHPRNALARKLPTQLRWAQFHLVE